MANEKDAIVRKAKIEIDIGRSERRVESLTSKLKDLQRQSESTNVSEEERLETLRKMVQVTEQLTRATEDRKKQELDFERVTQRIGEARETNSKREISDLQKQLRLREDLNRSEKKRQQTILQWDRQQEKEEAEKQQKEQKQRLAAARTIFEHKQSIRAARQSDLEFAFVQNPARMGSSVSKQNAKVISDLQKRQAEAEEKKRRIRNLVSEQNAKLISDLQKRKAEVEEQLRRKMEEISSGGISGVVGGMFDPTLGNTVSARWRTMSANGVFGKAARSTLQRFASQAVWNIQGRVISAAYNTARAGFESSQKMEEWLAETKAIAGATSGSMNDLAKSIYEVASNSRYTTEELTRTTTVLAQAGYSAEEISKLLGSVNSLASATGTDLRTSVDLLTSSMSLWNAQSSDAARMADALTVAVNKTKAEINTIQKGLQYAGASASQMGMSFEETIAAMSAVTNAGLKNRSITGTGLRALLTELADPSKKLEKELKKLGLTVEDVNVRTEGFTQVIQKLSDAGFTAENAFRGLDRQAASFYLASKQQLDLNKELVESMNQRGTVERAEQVRMDTTLAQLGRLKNTWFQIASDIGSPSNKLFKGWLLTVNEISGIIEKLTRSLNSRFSTEWEKYESRVERATNDVDSAQQSLSSLADEIVRLSGREIELEGSSDKVAKAHLNLADRFDQVGKHARSLITDLKALKEYEADLVAGKTMEFLRSKQRQADIGGQARARILKEMESVANIEVGEELSASSQMLFGVGTKKDLYSLLSMSSASQLEKYLNDSKILGRANFKEIDWESISELYSATKNAESIKNMVGANLSEDDVKKMTEDLQKGFDKIRYGINQKTGKRYDKLSSWRGQFSMGKLDTYSYVSNLLAQSSAYTAKIEEAASDKYLVGGSSVLSQPFVEAMQTARGQVEDSIIKVFDDIEDTIKDSNKDISRAKLQGKVQDAVEKMGALILSSNRNIELLDQISAKLKTDPNRKELNETVMRLRDEALTKNLAIQKQRYSERKSGIDFAYSDPELQLEMLRQKAYSNKSGYALNNLQSIRNQLSAARANVSALSFDRGLGLYSAYSDAAFNRDLMNPAEELVVKLQLDEQAATEEAARLGVYGDGFWDQTGNSMKQGARDFFNNINQQSAAYSLTLEGLNSVSSGLKNAFRAIATDGMKVSDAFKQMAQSILQSLANKAIDKGVDYMMFAAGQALGFVGTGIGASGGASGGQQISNSVPKNITPYPGAVGGLVTTQGIRRFAAGGGVVGRDSVPALLMPGEYVMKKSAVDMLGKETLDSLNRATSRVSDEKASNIRESKSAKPVVTNVYVVSDAKEAGMTPNDVLVTIGRDILQGGQTRELIQQVVQGRY